MSNFNSALAKTLKHEGGYANDPDDPGKETYCGISRKFWPTWAGWAEIDKIKTLYPGAISQGMEIRRPNLPRMVEDFYRAEFWNPMRLDILTNAPAAELLFDMAVNLGQRPAIKIFQTIINEFSISIKIDGNLGPKTAGAVNDLIRQKNFINSVVQCWINEYFAKTYENPVKRKFLRGWILRAADYIQQKD